MDAPLCKLCRNRHYASEAHIWASRDFKVVAPVESEAPKPVRVKKEPRGGPNVDAWSPDDIVPAVPSISPNGYPPVVITPSHAKVPEFAQMVAAGTAVVSQKIPTGLTTVGGSTQSRENRSRYRTPESAEAYRAYMRDYMTNRRKPTTPG